MVEWRCPWFDELLSGHFLLVCWIAHQVCVLCIQGWEETVIIVAGNAGTAAEAVVAEWAAAAKARAVAEQALRLLQAHASAQEASVS